MDILTNEDIKLMVDTFYGRVREDEILSPIFDDKIKGRWPMHLEKMYGFWASILLQERSYYGNPFIKHVDLPIDKLHFDRWENLFYRTVDDLFEGKKAEEAKWRARKMSEIFQIKLSLAKNIDTKIRPIL